MKRPMWVGLGVAAAISVIAIAVGRNHRPAELPRINDVSGNGKRRILIPVSDIMHEQFGPRHDPSEAIAGD